MDHTFCTQGSKLKCRNPVSESSLGMRVNLHSRSLELVASGQKAIHLYNQTFPPFREAVRFDFDMRSSDFSVLAINSESFPILSGSNSTFLRTSQTPVCICAAHGLSWWLTPVAALPGLSLQVRLAFKRGAETAGGRSGCGGRRLRWPNKATQQRTFCSPRLTACFGHLLAF